MSLTTWISLGVLVCSCGFQLVATLCAILFILKRHSFVAPEDGPPVSCLKPLCGMDQKLIENLASFSKQDYPDYEVVLGIANSNDPVLKLVKRSMPCSAKMQIALGERGKGINRKIRNLRNIKAACRPDSEFMVFSDSDVQVSPCYLAQVIGPMLGDGQIGATTCLYRIDVPFSLGSMTEALAIESSFIPGVLVAAISGSIHFALGATIGVRRSALQEVGGLKAIEDYLADDYMIGKVIADAGWKVILSPYVVSITDASRTFRKAISHLLRWNRTVRSCEPAGYMGSVICNTTIWALFFLLLVGGTTGLIAFFLAVAIRILAALVVALSIGSRSGMLRALLVPIWDLLSLFLWAGGLVGSTVIWREHAYRIKQGGRIDQVVHG